MLKYSRQRESIKKILADRKDHPTAEMIYSDVQKIYPKISLGTVYRNLSLLADMGEINRVSFGSGPDRFDGNMTPHCHFICRKCGTITDIDLDIPKLLYPRAEQQFSGIIDNSQVQFFGICPDCKN